MINAEELAICKRRGHKATTMYQYWVQCEACGMWIRDVHTIEEREDDPPPKERYPQAKSIFES